MRDFFSNWANAAYTSIGFFWMALWAFVLGYFLSSLIQVFVTKERMRKAMGKDDLKSVGLGTFFGFLSSSCSFSALATTKSLFQKGAGFLSSLAFLLASTNLVIELGIIISIFLGWQFVVGEYIGGILLILVSWILVKIIRPNKLIDRAREKLDKAQAHSHHHHSMKELGSKRAWEKVSRKYVMEWKMVWKDVTLGFTIAGIVAVFVPESFFQELFVNSASGKDHSFWELLQHSLIGPIAAFFTFIGSMGNIPLAALLYDHGVSFAGVMAFIFSDLVVFPVLRINAKYYGWKMSLFILFLLFASLIVTSLSLHYSFAAFDLLPKGAEAQILDREFFALDYSFYLNLLFIVLSAWLIFKVIRSEKKGHDHEMAQKGKWTEMIMKVLAIASFIWLAIGLILKFLL